MFLILLRFLHTRSGATGLLLNVVWIPVLLLSSEDPKPQLPFGHGRLTIGQFLCMGDYAVIKVAKTNHTYHISCKTGSRNTHEFLWSWARRKLLGSVSIRYKLLLYILVKKCKRKRCLHCFLAMAVTFLTFHWKTPYPLGLIFLQKFVPISGKICLINSCRCKFTLIFSVPLLGKPK